MFIVLLPDTSFCPQWTTQYSDKCYTFRPVPLDHTSAEADCQLVLSTAKLVSIETEEENEFIKYL